MNKKLLLVSFLLSVVFTIRSQPFTIDLNGRWERGLERKYDRTVEIPSVTENAAEMTPGKLWFKRTVDLPKGEWTHATLYLKGARFNPEVYIDGVLVSKKNGGMAPTFHFLDSKKNKAWCKNPG